MPPFDLPYFLAAWEFHFPPVVALAIVALLGYLVGRRAQANEEPLAVQARRELKRAQAVARDLERVADSIRKSVARHQTSVVRFRTRLDKLRATEQDKSPSWGQLCTEAEELLRPTFRLATQLAEAYDEIRQQGNQLMTFTEVRTDPLTGLSNRRALDEALAAQVALSSRYGSTFSLVIFDIDHFKRVNDEQGHLAGDRVLQSVARTIDTALRETDLVARYGGEEFVVLMPQTDLAGAGLLSDRLREKVEQQNPVTVSGGVASILEWESPTDLLARADAALYSAKSAGRNRVHRHTSAAVEPLTQAEVPA